MPGIVLSTNQIADIEVEVPCLGVKSPVETLELLEDGLNSEHLEAEEKTEGIGPVHRGGGRWTGRWLEGESELGREGKGRTAGRGSIYDQR